MNETIRQITEVSDSTVLIFVEENEKDFMQNFLENINGFKNTDFINFIEKYGYFSIEKKHYRFSVYGAEMMLDVNIPNLKFTENLIFGSFKSNIENLEYLEFSINKTGEIIAHTTDSIGNYGKLKKVALGFVEFLELVLNVLKTDDVESLS